MKALNKLADQKWARQNFGQLMTMSALSTGEIDLLFLLLQQLGFEFYGGIIYPKGNINSEQTLIISPLYYDNAYDVVVDYENRKIVMIYITKPYMNVYSPETDFILYTELDGIQMTFSEVEQEIQRLLYKRSGR